MDVRFLLIQPCQSHTAAATNLLFTVLQSSSTEHCRGIYQTEYIVLSLLVALRRRSKQHEIQWSLPEYWFSDKSIVLMNKELAIDTIFTPMSPKKVFATLQFNAIFIACTLTEDKKRNVQWIEVHQLLLQQMSHCRMLILQLWQCIYHQPPTLT